MLVIFNQTINESLDEDHGFLSRKSRGGNAIKINNAWNVTGVNLTR